MRTPGGGALLGVSTFWIRHVLSVPSSQFSVLRKSAFTENRELGTENFLLLIQFTSNLFQRRPPRIFQLVRAGTRAFVIQILPAMRAHSLAVLAANRFQRDRQ